VLRATPQYALQGEIVGPGIQKNRLGLKEVSLYVFNVYDIAGARYLDHAEARAFLVKAGIPAVETIETGAAFAYNQDDLLALAEGKYPGTSNEREGIVIRPLTERYSPALGGRLSFKAISNRFLLKDGD
jgi:RNA ligase (TIGR02306 family)